MHINFKSLQTDDKMIYEQSVSFIGFKDEEQHELNNLQRNHKQSTKNAHALTSSNDGPDKSMLKFFNCNNMGHGIDECLLEACGFCKQFDCGKSPMPHKPASTSTGVYGLSSRNGAFVLLHVYLVAMTNHYLIVTNSYKLRH
jgi:hypothetical protein